MLRRFGPRTAVEAAFLIAVPIVVAVAGFGAITIIGGSALAYLLVLAVEIIQSRDPAYAPQRTARLRQTPSPQVPAEPAPAAPSEHVRVVTQAEPEPAAAVEPPPAPPTAEPAPEPVATEPELEPEPEPEPEPAQPPVATVPEPEPAPPPAAPEPTTVVPIGVGAAPRRWNLWQLEELVKATAGDDPGVDEERSYLLRYLRDFADPSGELPLDFDGLVRESFGDLVGIR